MSFEINIEFAGQAGVLPNLARMTSTDTYAVITATGYLGNNSFGMQTSLNDGDFVFAHYDIDGTPDSAVFIVSISNRIITLLPYPGDSDIALTNAHILVGNASNKATDVAMSGDIGITNTGVTSISSGVIVNADVNASAAIAFSKLAALPSAQILVGSAGNVPTATTVTGDVTISNTGGVTIANSAVTTAKIANSNVTLGKLASGITPSHIIVAGGFFNFAGGSATATTTIGTAQVGDLPIAVISGSTNAVSIQKVFMNSGTTLNVVMSADPGADSFITYMLFRAAS